MMHGGEVELAVREYGISRENWLDLSTGVNPNGYEIVDLPQSAFHKLPEQFAKEELIAAARAYYRIPDGVSVVGAPGAQLLIQALPQLRPRSKVAIVSPTFSSHGAAWRRFGHEVTEIYTINELQDQSVVVIVNPNNPDGRSVEPRQLAALAHELTERGGLLVIDEAFADVSPDVSFVPYHDNSNVIVLRSIGKFFGLAGLRLGFAIGPNRYLQLLVDFLGAWSVSGPAIAVGRQALNDTVWQNTMLSQLRRQSDQHRLVFTGRQIKLVGGTLLFHLIEADDARTLQHQLAQRAVLTRRFEYNPRWLRIGLCKTKADLQRFETLFDEAYQAMQLAA